MDFLALLSGWSQPDPMRNVFYELGVAHALGKQSLLMCQPGVEVPFDVRYHEAFESPENAHDERFVRSIKEECLDRLIPFGERHFRRPSRSLSPVIRVSGIIKAWATN